MNTAVKNLGNVHGRRVQIIIENRALLDMIVQGLMEKKTLTNRDIKAIREKVA